MSCLDADVVTALLDGGIPPEARRAIDDHVDECAACRQWVAAAARARAENGSAAVPAGVASEASATPAAFRHVMLAPGTRVGRYVVTEFLGAGAMGVVYAARDPQLDRSIALKVVRTGAAHEAEARARRLVREAQAMARVSHPNVVPIYDAGQDDALVFIAMERIDGVSLRDYLKTPRPSRDVLGLVCGAGRGLAAAHAAGIVHRDFKPDNVLVGASGDAKVGDFGLAALGAEHAIAAGSVPPGDADADADADARADRETDRGEDAPIANGTPPDGGEDAAIANGTPHLAISAPPDRGAPVRTADGAVVGTPAYMAPEVMRGMRADARSDQYSFALTVAEALGEGQPRRIRNALARARAEDPAQRFASVADLVRALERRSFVVPAIVVVAVAAIAWFAWPRSQDAAVVCDSDTRAQLEGVFHPYGDADLRIHATTLRPVHARDAMFALERLERYTGDWLAMAQSSCRATRVTGEQSAELYDRRSACLSERLDDIALVSRDLATLDDAHAAVAQRLADSLGDLDQCVDPRGTGGSATARALRTKLVEVHTLMEQGYFDKAEPALEALLAEARAAHLPAVEASLLMSRSALRARTHQKGAMEGFHEALAIAERIGEPGLRIDALNALLADAVGDRSRESEIVLLASMIERGLAELPGKQLRRRGIAQGNLSNYYHDKQDYPAAERAAQAAYDAFLVEVGPVHPYTLRALQTQSRIQARQNHEEKAIVLSQRVIDALHKAYGNEHPMLVGAELDLGVDLAFAQRLDDAGAAFQRALAIAERIYGPDHVVVAQALRKVGFFEIDRHPAVARDAFMRAIAISSVATRRNDEELIPLLVGLGNAQLAMGDAQAAVPTLERAFDLWGTSQTTPHLRPDAKYALARALWDAHGDRERAKKLAEEARTEYLANQGPWVINADKVAKWQAAHR